MTLLAPEYCTKTMEHEKEEKPAEAFISEVGAGG
jgi:hypothetical protein